MPATVKQSYICEDCGGRGRIGHEHSVTDRHAIGEQQWRGYYPTNLCHACNGAGVWGIPQPVEEKVVVKPAPQPKAPVIAACDQDDWEDPRDRI